MSAAWGALRVRGLRAAYGAATVLHDVDLDLAPDQLCCVLGPSGCGKSTLLRAIAGFHRPASGRIELGGRTLDGPGVHLAAERRRVGYIPQDIALFPHLSTAANVGFGLPRSMRGSARRARIAELLDLADIAEFGARRPHELSGGQQQRVALARALAPRPDLLVLDEPFSALDAALRARVRSEVGALLRRTGTAAVLVTHDAEDAAAFADVLVVLAAGRVLQIGRPQDVYERPSGEAVARATGEANLLEIEPVPPADGVASNAWSAGSALGRLVLRVPPAGRHRALVRPRQVGLHAEPGPDRVRASVVASTFRGADHRVEIVVPGLSSTIVVHTDRPPDVGATVFARVDGAVHTIGT